MIAFSRFTPTLQRGVEGRSRKGAPPNNFEGQVADAGNLAGLASSRTKQVPPPPSPPTYHARTQFYRLPTRIRNLLPSKHHCRRQQTMDRAIYIRLSCSSPRTLVDSVRLTHYLLDSLFQPETLVSYTKRRLESWYVSLWCIA